MRVAVVVALTSWCSVAAANTGSIALTDESGLQYFINTNITFSTSSSASGADSEASYVHPVAASTAAGGITSSTLNDMFDGYNTVCISTTPGTCETGNANFEIYNRNGRPTAELGGRQLVFQPQTFASGLIGSRKVFVPENDEYQRWLNIFTNPTAAPITFTVNAANNLGSDGNTVITGSSRGGGTSITAPSTLWVTTFQNYSGTTTSDPRIAHILQGAGAPVPMSAVSFNNGDDNPWWSYTLTLPPGGTAIILNLVSGQPSIAQSIAKATELSQGPATIYQGMTATERSQVVNFNVGCAAIHDQCHDAVVGENGACSLIPLTNTPCTDDNVCTTIDRCIDGECVGSTPIDCTAGNRCVTGTCDPQTGCAPTTPLDSSHACDDGNACTDSDACDGAGTCVGVANASIGACDDHNGCTNNDVCNGSGICAGTANVGQACNDKNDCTDGDVCDASGHCIGTTNSKTTCTNGPCNPGLCLNGHCFVTDAAAANGHACDTGDACESNDVCFNGTCVAQPKECTVSPRECFVAACHAGTGCVKEPRNSGSCDDNDPCTVDDTCSVAGCKGRAMDCSAVAGDACHVGVCDGGQCAVAPAADGTTCDDGDSATKGDACHSGVCSGNDSSGYSTCSNLGSSGSLAFALMMLLALARRRQR